MQSLAAFPESLEVFVPGALTISGDKGHLWKSLVFCSQHSSTREKKADQGYKKDWECAESS